MKRFSKIPMLALLFATAFFATGFVVPKVSVHADLTGAWQLQDGSDIHTILFMSDYVAYTNYSKEAKQFTVTLGGRYKLEGDKIVVNIEFHSANKDLVGQTVPYAYSLANDKLTVTDDGEPLTLTKLDDGTSPLAGVWHITGRMQEGKVVPVQQTGTRKTVKILTGSRFQWVAMDTGTKEFSGTGGGTYTFANGKYTENIEFFSRDNNRVGASLSFDGKLQPDGWHHSGLSSRGDKIYEIWNKVK